MDQSTDTDDFFWNVVKKTGGNFKGASTGKAQSPRGSPTLRRQRTHRREFHARWWSSPFLPGTRLIFILILSVVWLYLGLCVQSKWGVLDANKPEFIGYLSAEVGNAKNLYGVSRTIDALIDNPIDSAKLDSVILKHDEEVALRTGRGRRARHRSNSNRLSKNVPLHDANTKTNDDGRIPRRNTSYGWVIGPFGKTEDRILGRNGDTGDGKCDKKSEFGRLVGSKKFVLIFHELSITGAPLSMMELASEISNCGGSVSAVVLCWKGGLMKELNRRRIRVLKDRGEISYKIARRSDLIVAGSAVCSSWIEQYLLRYGSRSTGILWWIMENRREYFERSKHLLNRVKMVIFLAETQSQQWMKWCEEEKVQLKTQPKTVPLSVNDELAFVAGIPCYLNKPSFEVEDMQAKRKLLRFAVREELGLSDDDMLVITLSSINPGKGQKLLLESVVLLRNEDEDEEDEDEVDDEKKGVKVLIGSVGSKSNKIPYVKRILRYISSRNSSLKGSLLWTPATTHVSSIYAAADVYVINAQGIGETFGRVTIEAMAFGLPVLGTDAGGTREIVKDNITGLLHPIGREGIEPLARNLEVLLASPSAREQLGKNGRLKVENMYMKQHMYAKLAKAFVQCMRIRTIR